MFESAELGHSIDKATYAAEVPALREALLDLQYDLLEAARFPVILLIGGVDGAGKGETVNLLNEWMDPRHIRVHAMAEASESARLRPPMWRFWRALPPKGQIGVFFGSWYTAPIVDRVMGETREADLRDSIAQINRFERMLAQEGALILKFWFHLAKDVQKRRLKLLEKSAKTAWRVTPLDWQRFKRYDKFRKVSEGVLRETSTGMAPWIVVEGANARYRNLTVGRILLEAVRKRLDHPDVEVSAPPAAPLLAPIDQRNVLRALDLSQRLGKTEYRKQLHRYQSELNLLTRNPKFARLSLIAAFEGADAAGKGGAIRRITQALDARHYRIIPVAAPSDEERAQPYLWRFWRHVPRPGCFTIFDRTWYGRVLVERVEGYCREQDWMRAYSEINDFEEQLAAQRILMAKFWLTISKDEQLRRFQEREKIGFKRFKITPDDWRNREKWDDYERAVCDMVDRTSTAAAPWTLVEADDKYFARIKILRTLVERLDDAL